MNDKIKEVALRVAREMEDPDDGRLDYGDYLTRCLQELSKDVEPALSRYNKYMGCETEADPIERLRFFLSLALNGQDWLDVEQFINDCSSPLTEQDKQDAERLDWLSNVDASKFILSCGKRWYWRTGYSQPHHRVKTLREAIDKAMENGK